jgi:hypothetical protein
MDFFMMPGFMDQIRPQQEIAVEYVSHRGSVESITSLNAPQMRKESQQRSGSGSSGGSVVD